MAQRKFLRLLDEFEDNVLEDFGDDVPFLVEKLARLVNAGQYRSAQAALEDADFFDYIDGSYLQELLFLLDEMEYA